MFGLGGMEIAALMVIGLLLFGKRLPELAGSLGRSVISFQKAIRGVEDQIETASSAPAMPVLPERMPPPRFEEPAPSA